MKISGKVGAAVLFIKYESLQMYKLDNIIKNVLPGKRFPRASGSAQILNAVVSE